MPTPAETPSLAALIAADAAPDAATVADAIRADLRLLVQKFAPRDPLAFSMTDFHLHQLVGQVLVHVTGSDPFAKVVREVSGYRRATYSGDRATAENCIDEAGFAFERWSDACRSDIALMLEDAA